MLKIELAQLFDFRSQKILFYNAKSTALRLKQLLITKQIMVPRFSSLHLAS